MTEKGRRSILGIVLPDGVIDAADRRAVLGIYIFDSMIGWLGKIIGVASANIYKINSVSRLVIARINGK